ncbi:MAG: MBOAT family protein [Clostridia bacterium]|nr:MBOAT family protein [Clostridia bacterium]
MNFNSLQYLLFLPITLILYFTLPKKVKNPLLLAASFFFYGCWEPVYALLMLFSIVATYFCGRLVAREKTTGKKKLWLTLCLVINLAILFFFKYFNFFADTLGLVLGQTLPTLNVLLPVGISFYTFQALGYTIDVYRGDVPAERNFIDYALFVSFFPQLVAGPIERTGNIVPQLKVIHKFRFANLRDGMLLILWGLMKKMVIADNLALAVNTVYNAPYDKNGVQMLFATLCFAFQIYCDFSAYSDIARGSAKILGIRLMRNFDFPYGARSIKEFWRRWHISLSTWFKDYLYFPLGGSRVKKWRHCLNLMIVFVVSGLWHGAAITYVLWGFLHGAYQIIGIWLTPLREKFYAKILAKDHPVMSALRWLGTFILVNIAWVLFRANSLQDAWFILSGIFTLPFGASFGLGDLGITTASLIVTLAAVVVLIAVDFLNHRSPLADKINRTLWLRYAVYFLLLLSILIFGYYGDGFDPQDFVYFQF